VKKAVLFIGLLFSIPVSLFAMRSSGGGGTSVSTTTTSVLTSSSSFSYGAIYLSSGAILMSISTTPTKASFFNTNGISQFTVPDHTVDEIVIGTGGVFYSYFNTVSTFTTAGTTDLIYSEIRVNGAQTGITCQNNVTSFMRCSAGGLLSLTSGSTVSLYLSASSATIPTPSFKDAQLVIFSGGGVGSTSTAAVTTESHYGAIYLSSGASSQSVSTTPVKVTAFDTNGLFSGSTPDHSNDQISISTTGTYNVLANIISTNGTAGLINYYYQVRVNDIATDISCQDTAFPRCVMAGLLSLSASDAVSVYVAADSTGSYSIVTTDAQLYVAAIGGGGGSGSGDIESVTAGYGLSGGGTSGDVTLNLLPTVTNYIWNTNILQSGSTFYVSSGTVLNQLSVGDGSGSRLLFDPSQSDPTINLYDHPSGGPGAQINYKSPSGVDRATTKIDSVGYVIGVASGTGTSLLERVRIFNTSFISFGDTNGGSALIVDKSSVAVLSGRPLVLYDTGGNFYVALESSDTLTHNQRYVFTNSTGTPNQALSVHSNNPDGSQNLYWQTVSTGAGSANPAGSDTEIQLNESGVFGSSNTFTFDYGTGLFTIGASDGQTAIVDNNITIRDTNSAGSGDSYITFETNDHNGSPVTSGIELLNLTNTQMHLYSGVVGIRIIDPISADTGAIFELDSGGYAKGSLRFSDGLGEGSIVFHSTLSLFTTDLPWVFQSTVTFNSSTMTIAGIQYFWPLLNSTGTLTNNGSGVLSWTASSGGADNLGSHISTKTITADFGIGGSTGVFTSTVTIGTLNSGVGQSFFGLGLIVNNSTGGTTNSDFQVKGDNDANLIQTRASADLVSIGTNTFSHKLRIQGGLLVTSSVTVSSLNCTGNTNGGVVTTDSSGQLVCSDDDTASNGDNFGSHIATKTATLGFGYSSTTGTVSSWLEISTTSLSHTNALAVGGDVFVSGVVKSSTVINQAGTESITMTPSLIQINKGGSSAINISNNTVSVNNRQTTMTMPGGSVENAWPLTLQGYSSGNTLPVSTLRFEYSKDLLASQFDYGYVGLRSKPGESNFFIVTGDSVTANGHGPYPDDIFRINVSTNSSNYGYVGINVATPTSRLHVGGDATLTSTVTLTGGRLLESVVTLTDASTIATDASLGNIFTVTLGGNRTLGNPTNPVNGQKAVWRIRQDGTGSRTISFGSDFRFSIDVPMPALSTSANLTDYIGAIYNSTDSKWDVVAVSKGY
jgi:hypothetical protein